MIPLSRPGRDQPAYIGFKWKRKASFFRRSFTSKCFILLGFCVRLLVYPPIPCKRETKLKVLHNKRILPPLLADFLNRHSRGSASASPTHFPFHQTPRDLVEWKMASRIRQAGRLRGVKEKPAPDVFVEGVCFLSPATSWLAGDRWQRHLPGIGRAPFLPLSPDFVFIHLL